MFPSKIKDPIKSIGPQNKPTQAVTANPPIFLLSGLAITIPKDHAKAPESNNKIPINFHSRLGEPNKIKSPTKAIIIGRLHDGKRFVANTAKGDTDLLNRMMSNEMLKIQGIVTNLDSRNIFQPK